MVPSPSQKHAPVGSQPVVTAFLVVGRKRPGFDPEWGKEIEAAAQRITGGDDFTAVWLAAKAVDDTTLRQAVDEARRLRCQAMVVLQPTMGDGRLAPILAQLWDRPLVFWATPERPTGLKVSSCSLVGTHVMATTVRQLGHAFELVYGDPDAPETARHLAESIRLAALAAGLRRSKIGLVGGHAPGFINMHADPGLLAESLGVQLHDFGLQEFFDLVEGLPAAEVDADVAKATALGLPFSDGVGPGDLAPNSRYYLAMRKLMADENLGALALRCWPELPNRFGHWPYLAMSRLAEEGGIVALEGDVYGALTCLVGQMLGLGAGYISDWLEHDRHSILLWHPGHAAPGMVEAPQAQLGRHFNNNLPLVVNAPLRREHPLTLARIWACDGEVRIAVREARTVAPGRELSGVYGRVAIPDLDVHEWFCDLCQSGMPHHVTLLPGHHARLLDRAAQLLGLRVVG